MLYITVCSSLCRIKIKNPKKFHLSYTVIYACTDNSISKTQSPDNKPYFRSIFIDLQKPFDTFNYKSF